MIYGYLKNHQSNEIYDIETASLYVDVNSGIYKLPNNVTCIQKN